MPNERYDLTRIGVSKPCGMRRGFFLSSRKNRITLWYENYRKI